MKKYNSNSKNRELSYNGVGSGGGGGSTANYMLNYVELVDATAPKTTVTIPDFDKYNTFMFVFTITGNNYSSFVTEIVPKSIITLSRFNMTSRWGGDGGSICEFSVTDAGVVTSDDVWNSGVNSSNFKIYGLNIIKEV